MDSPICLTSFAEFHEALNCKLSFMSLSQLTRQHCDNEAAPIARLHWRTEA